MVKHTLGSSVDKKMESLKRGGMSIKRANADDQDTLAEIDAVLSSAEEQTDRLMRRYDLIG